MNTKKPEEKIPWTEAAVFEKRTIEGWWSKNGRFWGEDERAARYDGCTHRECEICGYETEKMYCYCPRCSDRKAQERFLKLPIVEWDEETPLCLFDDDHYFWDKDQVLDYADENECKPEDLQLVLCEPQHLHHVEIDYWEDKLPEDYGELPDDVQEALNALNKAIDQSKPTSWIAGDKRVKVTA